jgi:hypothetical protein
MLLCLRFGLFAQAVFKNPGMPSLEIYEITDHIDNTIGYVNTKIASTLKESNGKKYYYIYVTEGNVFSNEIEVNYSDLTTISEKRVDLRTNTTVEYFTNNGKNLVHLFNKDKKLDKDYSTSEKNIYSRYAYFFAFSGFPFETEKSVTFKSYMFEYGDALPMKVTNLGRQKVTVKAGTFECYKLELSVAGWQSVFARDKYSLYYAVASPHHFVKYEETESGGKLNTNELIRITKMQK